MNFSKKEWIIYSLILITGLVLRWYGLDVRPLHHDESLNAIYGQYYFENSDTGFYKYNPMLHGPFLYHILPFFYQVFDVTKFSIRILPCLLGSIFLFGPIIFKRYFSNKTIIFQTLFIALSPSLIYWSRFLRHDYLVIASILIMIFGLVFTKKYKSLFFLIGLTLHFCIKENVFITIAFILGYLIYESFILNFSKDTYFKRSINYCKNYKIETLIGIILSIIIFCYFFSAGFKYPQGILDGLYRKSFLYWFNQHNISRIGGPFIFQFLVLSWYEFIFIILLFAQTFHFYKRATKKYLVTFILSFIPALFCYFNFSKETYSLLKLIIPGDTLLFFPLIIHALNVTTFHIKENERILSMLGYFFLGSFFTYSFVGEKVPWLSLYILLSGIIYITFYFQKKDFTRRLDLIKFNSLHVSTILIALVFLFNLRISLFTNFSRAGHATQFISQVHTTQHYENVLFKIRNEIEFPYKQSAPKVLDLEENTWPLTWYFLNKPGFKYVLGNKKVEDFDYIFAGQHNERLKLDLAQTHNHILIPMRHWWVPNYSKMNPLNYLQYAINQTPWNSTGEKYISLFSRKISDR